MKEAALAYIYLRYIELTKENSHYLFSHNSLNNFNKVEALLISTQISLGQIETPYSSF